MNVDNEVNLYPYAYVYNDNKIFLIWETNTNGMDVFRLNSENCLVESNTEKGLKELLGFECNKVKWVEGAEINFDNFWKALKDLKIERGSSQETCELLLEGWNFIEDMAKTFGHYQELKRLHSPLLNKVYEKLFYGNNLPAVTPQEIQYIPLWLPEEIYHFRKEIKKIWQLFIKLEYIKSK